MMNGKLIKNILVTGANGQLGTALRDLASDHPAFRFFFALREELLLTRGTAVEKYFIQNKIHGCINCAAYTAVDKAEEERGEAYAVNSTAPGILAAVCEKYNALFIHFSTDYVFDGKSHAPYTESDQTSPLNYYGETKLAGERAVQENNPTAIIIRTSWVYSDTGKNFVKTMMRLMKEKKEVSVVNDQLGSPTYAHDLANAVMRIISGAVHQPGVYHYSNEGIISWYDFALAIKGFIGSDCLVNGIPTSAYPTPAKRSLYSAMDTKKIRQTFNISIRPWKDSLGHCIALLSR